MNSELDVLSGCQTVKIVIPKPELAFQISKPSFEGFLSKIKVNGAIQTSLKNGPTPTIGIHVT